MDTKNKNTQEPKFEITKDNILHYFMHAATREDIAELRAENKANISELRAENKANISELRADTKASIGELRQELKADMSKLDSKMDDLRRDNNKYFRWIVGLMFGSFAGIALMILKFPFPLIK